MKRIKSKMRNKLNSKKIIETIENNKNKISKYGVKKIGLFGSFVKEKQKPKSDIDIIVNFDKIDFDNYLNLLNFLEKIFEIKIDLVIENDLKPELRYIKKEVRYVKI